jgi:ribonuclease Z
MMAKLVFLGTSNAVPDKNHENTHMAILGNQHRLLIDCGSNPIVRLEDAKIDALSITDLIITHFHPDHVFGLPLLIMSSWLMGRKEPLNIYGLEYSLERIKIMMEAFEWASWQNFYPVEFYEIPEIEMSLILDSSEIKVWSSPVHHIIPTIGVRIEFPEADQVLAYSCDTQPCEEVIKLANHADVLIHEAGGASRGHTSASQAGRIASESGVSQLYLIHYPTGVNFDKELVRNAQKTFDGPVTLAEDLMELFF